jgi:hypothetical protein
MTREEAPPAAFPAKAGIQWIYYRRSVRAWVPAFAGKTVGGEENLVFPLRHCEQSEATQSIYPDLSGLSSRLVPK